MPLQAPLDSYDNTPIRERIVIIGESGRGKTTIAWQIARALFDSGSSAQLWYIDTDLTGSKFLNSPRYNDLANVRLYPMRQKRNVDPPDTRANWQILRDASDEICGNPIQGVPGLAKPHDWIIVDMADRIWKEAQVFASCILQGEPNASAAAEKALQRRAAWSGQGKEPSDIEGWDWRHPNAMYDAFAHPILNGSPAHTLWLAPASSWSPDDKLIKDPEKRAMAATANLTPKGIQSSLVFQVDTVLALTKTMVGRYLTTMTKDREREMLVNAPLTNFVDDYLVPNGWKYV